MIVHNNMKVSSSIVKKGDAEMKVAKFQILCNLVNDCLNRGSDYESTAKIYLFYGEEYKNNLFMSCVKEMCTRKNKEFNFIAQFGCYDLMSECDDISRLIDRVKKLKIIKDTYSYDILKYVGDVIFWNLLAVTLDENVYEKNINKIIDLAYMFEFSEAMIKDWCRAVEFVLSGNFKGDFEQLNFDTAEANQYFKRVKNDTNKIVCSASGASTQNDCLSQIRNLFGATEPLKRY